MDWVGWEVNGSRGNKKTKRKKGVRGLSVVKKKENFENIIFYSIQYYLNIFVRIIIIIRL